MINTDSNHKHTYDEHGHMTCCTLEDKINAKAEKYTEDDGHQHDASGESNLKMFRSPIISLALLLSAIAMDNYITAPFFTGWLRVLWYVAAYIPVGFPVLNDAFKAIVKGEFQGYCKR